MSLLFFDTETTGLPDWKSPSDGPDQHRVCQVAMLMTDDAGKHIAGQAFLIQPDRWPPMEEEAFEQHGLTIEHLNRYGVSMDLVLPIFWAMLDQTTTLIGHNISFDKRMMRIEMKRRPPWRESLERLKEFPNFCTMRNAQKILKMPATVPMHKTGRHGAKPPKLEEAYEFFTGAPMKSAHEAMADVVACKRVYFGIQAWIKENGPVPEGPQGSKRKPAGTRKPAPHSGQPEAADRKPIEF